MTGQHFSGHSIYKNNPVSRFSSRKLMCDYRRIINIPLNEIPLARVPDVYNLCPNMRTSLNFTTLHTISKILEIYVLSEKTSLALVNGSILQVIVVSNAVMCNLQSAGSEQNAVFLKRSWSLRKKV